MSDVKRVDIKDFRRVLRADMRVLQKRVIKATHKAADFGAKLAKQLAPIAFRELRDGIIKIKGPGGALYRSTAPHSEAVEKGSRPHTPPLAPLVAWVKLRGMQGLGRGRKINSAADRSSRVADIRIAAALRNKGEVRGRRVVSTPVDAPEQIARAIQAVIAKRGTKPHWYMRRSVEPTEAFLHQTIDAALEAPIEASAAEWSAAIAAAKGD